MIDPLLPIVNLHFGGRAHVTSKPLRLITTVSYTYRGSMMQQSVHLKPAGGNGRTERGLTAHSRSIHRIRDSMGQGPFSSMLVLSYIGLVNPNGTKMELKKKKKTQTRLRGNAKVDQTF